MLLAVAVFGAVAFASSGTTGGSATATASSSTSSRSGPERVWSVRAQAVLTPLLDDLAAVDAATRSSGAADQAAAIAAAARSLTKDDERAKGLGSPGPSLASSWTAVLGEVDGLASTLSTASSGLSVAQVARVRFETASTANALAAFAAMLERARP